MKLKWELQDAICTSGFKVTYRKSYTTKMNKLYITKEFLIEKIAIVKS